MPHDDPSPKAPSFSERLLARFVEWREWVARSWMTRAACVVAVCGCVRFGLQDRSVGLVVLGLLIALPLALPSLRDAIEEVRERDRESDVRRKVERPPEEQ